MELSVFCPVAGLKAGDEILEINNHTVGTLSSSALRDFLLQPSLGLRVRTRPMLEGGAPLLESPPHRADGPVDLCQSPLAFLAGSSGKFGTFVLGRLYHPWKAPPCCCWSFWRKTLGQTCCLGAVRRDRVTEVPGILGGALSPTPAEHVTIPNHQAHVPCVTEDRGTQSGQQSELWPPYPSGSLALKLKEAA